jgi:hypothetical protein
MSTVFARLSPLLGVPKLLIGSHPSHSVLTMLLTRILWLQVKKKRDRLDPFMAGARGNEEVSYETCLLQGEHELR